ncbi:MAG: hypothetical protein ACOWWR_04615 [Eubacteriales bacterium]
MKNIKKTIYLFLLIFLLFLFILSVSAQPTEDETTINIPEGFELYQYQYAFLDISLIYPQDWINYSSQERGIMIYTPDSKGVLLLLGTPMFGEEHRLDELWKLNMENLKSAGAVFQESTSDKLSGYPAIKVFHTIKLGNEMNQYIRYSAIIGDLFYTFSFHTPINDFKR